MKILLCGGGTGGHITPILAIAHELKRIDPSSTVIYVSERGGKFDHLVKNVTSINQVKTIYAGKFRRYYGEPWRKRLIDFKTNLLNIRDFYFFIRGIIQSYFWLGKIKPDVIFIKGSYVGLPIGLAAKMRGIKYITHDSDAIPSLTNKVVGKWAVFNTTGMPGDLYSYPKTKIRFVGIPVAPNYELVTPELKDSYRTDINIPLKSKMILVTGGSLGARRLNLVISNIVDDLLHKFDDLHIVLQVGSGNKDVFDDTKSNKRLEIYEFMPNLYKYSGAADVVVTRSGANSISELAVQGKATIVVPNPQLTGGHQVKNAEELQYRNAALVLNEKEIVHDPQILLNTIIMLLNDKEQQESLSEHIRLETRNDSAMKIATLLTEISK